MSNSSSLGTLARVFRPGGRPASVRIAVIDVGFNFLKMVKYRVDPDGSIRSYGQLGAMVRLGEGLERAGCLESRPAARA